MYVVGGVEGGSTNVTIPVDLGNDLYLLKVCLHRPKEISLWKGFTQPLRNWSRFKHCLFHIVPRQCLSTCVYEWKKDPLISGCLFLTISTHKYRINVPFSTIGSQKISKNHLRPLYHGSKKNQRIGQKPYPESSILFSFFSGKPDGSLKFVKNPRWAVILFYLKPQTWGFLKFQVQI